MTTLTEAEFDRLDDGIRRWEEFGGPVTEVIKPVVERIIAARETALCEEIAAAIDAALYRARLIDEDGAPANDYALGGQHAARIAREARP